MPKTITRSQLRDSLYQEMGLSRHESSDLLAMLLEEIAAALSRDEIVKIATFGSFAVRQKRKRIGRNPKTGDPVSIRPRRVLTFRPSQFLKGRVSELTFVCWPPHQDGAFFNSTSENRSSGNAITTARDGLSAGLCDHSIP